MIREVIILKGGRDAEPRDCPASGDGAVDGVVDDPPVRGSGIDLAVA